MHRLLSTLLYLVMVLGSSALPAQENGFQRDFRQMTDSLRVRHPGLAPAPLPCPCLARFDALADSVHRRLASAQTPTDFYLTVMPFIHQLGDGHAWLSYSLRNGRYLPLQFRWFEEGLFILAVGDSLLNPLEHGRVEAVGPLPVPELERRINGFLGSDAGNPFHLRKPRFGNGFWMTSELLLRHLGLAQGDSVAVTVRKGQKVIRRWVRFQSPEHMPLENPFARGAVTAVRDTHFFTVHPPMKIVYFQFGSRLPPLESAWVDSLMQTAISNQAETLVLDLRLMSGGDPQALIDLFRYTITDTLHGLLYRAWSREGAENREIFDGIYTLAPVADSLCFHGRVVVFMGPTTFSAGTFPLVFTQDNALAELWGEPCGNNSVRYGESQKMKLPHSGLTFAFSTRLWQRASPLAKSEMVIRPDRFLPTCFADYRAGRDPLWEALVQSLQKGELP